MDIVAIAEDEDDLRDALAEFLTDRGLRVVTARDAAAFRSLAASESIQVAVLDVTIPGESGLSLARWLLRLDRPPGIILATAAGSQQDRVVGLELGVDDYLVKPYDPRELLARIRGVLRRMAAQAPAAAANPPAESGRAVAVGTLRLDLRAEALFAGDGRRVGLSANEFALLRAMTERPNRILSRSVLLDLARGFGEGESERTVDVRIARLRRKIEPDPMRPALIKTVRGEGYMYVPEDK